ncbi:hypothetical protein R1T08_02170 [Streptomyces sp. SBC-4]|nr:hypothetical protein [Streptomyces sp. SBC-4]MDV5143148.1 hypothetical protein [Streptomyces sp. SBC-4]
MLAQSAATPHQTPSPLAAHGHRRSHRPRTPADTLTDRGNAKLFARLYARDYRYVPGLGWYRWDGARWQARRRRNGPLGRRRPRRNPRHHRHHRPPHPPHPPAATAAAPCPPPASTPCSSRPAAPPA